MSILLGEQTSNPLTLTDGQRVYVRWNVRSTPTIVVELSRTRQMTQGLFGGWRTSTGILPELWLTLWQTFVITNERIWNP